MARYLLDTDAVIDYLFGIPDSVDLIRGLHDGGDVLCVCDVVVAEVFAGARAVERGRIGAFISRFTFLPTSPEAARQAGEWRHDHARAGRTLSATDTLIAATAQSHQANILTGNLGDYPMNEVPVLPLPRAAHR